MAYTDEYLWVGSAADTTLASDITSGSTTITLTSGTGWPSPTGGQKAIGVLAQGQSTEAKFTFTGRSGNDLTGVSFNFDGTTPAANYSAGTAVRHSIAAVAMNEFDYTKRETVGKITAANQILVSDAANSLTPLTVAASRILGRKASGDIDDMTPAELAALFGTPDGTKFLADDGTLKTPATAATPEGFSASRSTNQSLSAGTFTTIVFDTEGADQGSDYNNSTGEWTVPETGWYQVASYITFNALADQERYAVRFLVGGTARAVIVDVSSAEAGSWTAGGSVPLYLTSGNVVTVAALREVAGAVVGSASPAITYFTAVKI